MLDGVIAVEVDDLVTCGNEVDEERMAQLRERFRFGKSDGVGLMEEHSDSCLPSTSKLT